MFLTLEDETGLLNVVISPQLLTAQRAVIYATRSFVLDGVIEKQNGVVQLRAERIVSLDNVLEVVGSDALVRSDSDGNRYG